MHTVRSGYYKCIRMCCSAYVWCQIELCHLDTLNWGSRCSCCMRTRISAILTVSIVNPFCLHGLRLLLVCNMPVVSAVAPVQYPASGCCVVMDAVVSVVCAAASSCRLLLQFDVRLLN